MSKIIEHLSKDKKLAEIMPLIVLSEIDTHNDIYLDLLDSIVSQQLSVKVATVIFNRFLNLFDDLNPTPQKILDLDIEAMRGCGLSYQKAGYIKNIAQYWIDHHELNRDWLSMNDEEIIKELSSIKGVGKWTVQMILMFRLNRLDVFPIDDLGIRQGMTHLYKIESTGKEAMREMVEIAENWKPYRSTACRYVWRWKDTIKLKVES